MLAKSLTNASGILFSWRYNSSFICYTLGPLCLWQCFEVYLACTSSKICELIFSCVYKHQKNLPQSVSLVGPYITLSDFHSYCLSGPLQSVHGPHIFSEICGHGQSSYYKWIWVDMSGERVGLINTLPPHSSLHARLYVFDCGNSNIKIVFKLIGRSEKRTKS